MIDPSRNFTFPGILLWKIINISPRLPPLFLSVRGDETFFTTRGESPLLRGDAIVFLRASAALGDRGE